MLKAVSIFISFFLLTITIGVPASHAFQLPFTGENVKSLAPEQGVLKIPTKDISDGKAHYFKVKADDDIMVTFFAIKSSDGVIRAAIDACDVCFRSGKGLIQEGDFMVCQKCKKKFASNRINLVKGGCNPAPLNRNIVDNHVVISMKDINRNSWYCKFK